MVKQTTFTYNQQILSDTIEDAMTDMGELFDRGIDSVLVEDDRGGTGSFILKFIE